MGGEDLKSININIITTNSAFEDANLNHELARILRELADKVEDNDIPYYLNDINGNRVGIVEQED